MSRRKSKGSKARSTNEIASPPVSGGWERSLCDAGILGAGAIAACLSSSVFEPASAQQHFVVIMFGIALGFCLGMLLIRFRFLEAWTQPGWMRSEAVCFATAGVGLAALSYWCGMRQFGGFDHSLVIEAGWRLYNGQQPYVDFPCLLPVGFYLGAEYAFRWFGVFWSSIVDINVFYLLLTYAWMYLVLRQLFINRYLAFLLVFTCECMSMLLGSYWWYNPITDITVVLYLISAAAALHHPHKKWMWLSLCLSLALVALMKPNVSGVAMAGGTAALLLNRNTRLKACLVSLAAFFIWLAILAIHGSTITQVVGGYLSGASRGIFVKNFLHDTDVYDRVFAWSCVGVLLAPWCRSLRHQRISWITLSIFGLLSSAYGFYSNSEPKLVDLSAALLSAGFILGEFEPGKALLRFSSGWTCFLILICSTFAISSIDEAVTRHRVAVIGLGAFFEYQIDETPIPSGFFQGMRAGYNLHQTLSLMTHLCATGELDHIYFGPRLQWAYAAFKIQSPKGMPIWWDPGFAFPAKEEDAYDARWIDHRFNPLVMTDAMFFSETLLHSIYEHYVIAGAYPLHPNAGSLLILSRKD